MMEGKREEQSKQNKRHTLKGRSRMCCERDKIYEKVKVKQLNYIYGFKESV